MIGFFVLVLGRAAAVLVLDSMTSTIHDEYEHRFTEYERDLVVEVLR